MKRNRTGLFATLVVAALGTVAGTWASPPPEKAIVAPTATASAHPSKANSDPHAAGAPHWTYEGEAGPAAWGKLAPDFATCGVGQHQSPIDLVSAAPASDPKLRAAFPAAELVVAPSAPLGEAVHNGHTIQVDFPKGDELTLGGVRYELVQFHFHTPSEHTVAGHHLPMEIHFVHRSAEGKLAVVGVLVEAGAANAAFARLESALPKTEGARSRLDKIALSVGELLPKSHAIDRYDGSLTTPPCSEQVSWLVMTSPIELSAAQISALSAALPENSRPVQPPNGRAVVADELRVRLSTE